MPDRLAELALALAEECGALGAYVLLAELDSIARGRTFTAAEACAHALLPANARLRAAIVAVCGEVSARKLGKALARWEGTKVGSLRADCVGTSPNVGIEWKVSAVKLRPELEPVPNVVTMAATAALAESDQ